MDIIAKISEELGIRKNQAEAAVKLIDEGNTIPFIARYRKEATGALNDEVLKPWKLRESPRPILKDSLSQHPLIMIYLIMSHSRQQKDTTDQSSL